VVDSATNLVPKQQALVAEVLHMLRLGEELPRLA
jgi:hypothetical protein